MKISDILSEDRRKQKDSLEELYSKCYPKISRLIIRNGGSAEDALDVFQDGVLALYRNLKNGSFNNRSSLTNYLYSICKNRWYDHQRIIIKSRGFDNSKIDYSQSEPLIDRDKLHNCMKLLEVDCQNILIEFYYQKVSLKELAIRFNYSSVQVAKNKKARCLKYLMKKINAKGYNYSSFNLNNDE